MEKLVYLIKCSSSDKYKIGITKVGGLQNRLKNLQTGNHDELIVINTYKTEYASIIEKTLHRQYNYLKEEGEWFKFGLDEEMNFLIDCEKINTNIKLLNKLDNNYIKNQIKK